MLLVTGYIHFHWTTTHCTAALWSTFRDGRKEKQEKREKQEKQEKQGPKHAAVVLSSEANAPQQAIIFQLNRVMQRVDVSNWPSNQTTQHTASGIIIKQDLQCESNTFLLYSLISSNLTAAALSFFMETSIFYEYKWKLVLSYHDISNFFSKCILFPILI